MSFLYDHNGKRKYLTISEREAFLRAAHKFAPEVYTFCATLAFTGARISEILALRPDRFDFDDSVIIINCLKKRAGEIYRALPVPKSLLEQLDAVHGIRNGQTDLTKVDGPIWPWCRTTAWKYVKDVMIGARVSGPQACPKGLRHSFGVCSLQKGVPLNMVRKWLGHSRLTTTSIYADAMGDEERAIAGRFWASFQGS